jgi:hypothetical protein
MATEKKGKKETSILNIVQEKSIRALTCSSSSSVCCVVNVIGVAVLVVGVGVVVVGRFRSYNNNKIDINKREKKNPGDLPTLPLSLCSLSLLFKLSCHCCDVDGFGGNGVW